jgi:hypothetical protein
VVCARLETALFELQDAAAAAAAASRRGRWDTDDVASHGADACGTSASGEALARAALARCRAALVELDAGRRGAGRAPPAEADELARIREREEAQVREMAQMGLPVAGPGAVGLGLGTGGYGRCRAWRCPFLAAASFGRARKGRRI